MEGNPPGWYRDPKRPGIHRYWDGHAWIDVDQVLEADESAAARARAARVRAEESGESVEAAEAPPPATVDLPAFLVRQRRPVDDEPADPA